ncbi:MAG: histidinol-phosphate transaminase [Spirochaetes bacterium]|nr:histidinol-phosphate transaminase [Spirochaetota bacterium]
MSSIEDFIVPWVKEAAPYSDVHISYAWQNPSVARLMSNENFHRPSKSVIKTVKKTLRNGNLYPCAGMPLRQKIAEIEKVKPEQVFIGNGSSEIIDVLSRIFLREKDNAVIPEPTFPMYAVRVQLAGGTVVGVPVGKNLLWDVEKILSSIDSKTRLVFITSPNNPLGSIFPEEDLRKVLDTGVPIMLDEAYVELEDKPRSMSFLLKEYENLIVNHTMSKAWGIAGFRLGYSLSSPVVTDYMFRMRINFSIGTINMEAALAALNDIDYFNRQNEDTKTERNKLFTRLTSIEGLRAFPSEGNFILLDLGPSNVKADEAIEYFMKHDMQIRAMDKPTLGPGFIRYTIGTRKQNVKFIRLLETLTSDRK